MRFITWASCFAAVIIAAPSPQLIDVDGVDAAPDPEFVAAPVDVANDTAPPAATEVMTPVTTDVSKRSLTLKPRDGNCAVQPAGSGPVPTPDTPQAFSAYSGFAKTAKEAQTPNGYKLSFKNLNGSLSASKYMGLYTLTSYDVIGCASKCDQASGCEAFNIYIERDPNKDPNAQDCPNPPSLTNYKCTLWGAPVCGGQATNLGQWRDSFEVVIAGSNGYNKEAPPPGIPHYDGPTELGGAINAPLDQNGHNTYMGYKYLPFSQAQGFEARTCGAACDIQTVYNAAHPASDGSYQTCIFFNIYVLSKNGIPQGLYCSLYNETWPASYGTNYGQYRGNDRYSVSQSYSYSKKS